MLFAFIVQLFFALIFFGGISGIGIFLLKLFRIEKLNIFLRFALGFFLSLAFYTAFSVLLLFVLPDKLLVLTIFTTIYFFLSFFLFIKWVWNRKGDKKKFFLSFLKEYWAVFTVLFFSLFNFFLEIYKIALLDEWLHRPIVKFFVENGIFPLRNPLSPEQIFIYSYHYGTQIVGSALKLIFPLLTVSESLDVMKLGFFMASFLLFFGIIQQWSSNKFYSLLGATLLIFCGGSFFLFDIFSNSYLREMIYVRPFNYPLAFSLAGITWINLPISVAFTFFLQELFLKKKNYFNFSLLFLAPLFIGFFLISELFGILMAGLVGFSILLNLIRNKNPKMNILVGLSFLFFLSTGIFLTGGVIANLFKENSGFHNLVSFRNFNNWGYPNELNTITRLSQFPMRYFKDFFLEIIILFIITLGLIKRKISLADHPLFFLALPITFLIPFIISISMGDLNLYKLTAFGILVLHLLIFYYFSLKKRSILFYFLTVMFVLGSIPAVLFDFKIQFGSSDIDKGLRCAQNDLCYDQNIVGIFKDFEKNNPGLKNILVSPNDSPYVVDLSNSFAINNLGLLSSKESLQKSNVQYIFDSPDLESLLDKNSLEELKKYEKIEETGNYKILKVY